MNNLSETYYDVHIKYGSRDKDGYSFCVKTFTILTEEELLEKLEQNPQVFEESEDYNLIDYIDILNKEEIIHDLSN